MLQSIIIVTVLCSLVFIPNLLVYLKNDKVIPSCTLEETEKLATKRVTIFGMAFSILVFLIMMIIIFL